MNDATPSDPAPPLSPPPPSPMVTDVGYACDARDFTPANPTALAAAIVGLKIVGLLKLFDSLTYVPFLMTVLFQSDPGGASFGGAYSTTSVVAVFVIQLLLALLLLLGTRPLAKLAMGRIPPSSTDPMSATAWMTIILSGVGVLIVTLSINETVAAVIQLVTRVNFNVRSRMASPIEMAELLRMTLPLVKFAIGLLLFIRPRTFVSYWTRVARV